MNKELENVATVRNYTLIKQKHINKSMSNVPTSNIKFPTSSTAITLIALIITIIVLLILAGVTLNMVIGESGIFGKAGDAKNKTEIAQYEEELQLCILEIQADKTSKNENFNMDAIRKSLEKYVQKLQNEKIEWTDKEIDEPRGIYKKNNFYIDVNYKVHIGEKKQELSIKPKLKVNLGINNSQFNIYKGTPQYLGKENGVYLNNAILTTKCKLNSTFTILIETKDIELQTESNHMGMIVGYGYGASGVGSTSLGIIEWYSQYLGALSGAGDQFNIGGSFKEWYPANRWNILAIKYDGKEFAFYVNGEKKGSSSLSADKGEDIYVGGFSNSDTSTSGVSWGYSKGYYRNLAIYDQALTDSEIENYTF